MSIKETNTFELALKTAMSLPVVRIKRTEFLTSELSKYCNKEKVQTAIKYNPAVAGIDRELINQIANKCINYETNKVSAISFGAGLPGGIAMFGTVPADITQYFAHVLRIIQKLIYLYGWEELYDENGQLDDETKNLLILFLGVMFGVNGASATIGKLSEKIAMNVVQKLPQKALTKNIIFKIAAKIFKVITGERLTKELFSKGLGKVIPVIGGFISGGVTYLSYKPMSNKFKNYLNTLPMSDPSFYKSKAKEEFEEFDGVIIDDEELLNIEATIES